MHILGKILGLIFGYLLIGPVGAVLGMLMGHAFDRGLRQTLFINQADSLRAQEVFFRATFSIMGHIAKADGRISEDEIRVARAVMARLGLNEGQRQKAIAYFNQGKQANFALNETLQQLRSACQQHRALLQIFFDIQLQAAYADGGLLSLGKKKLLQVICQRLGVPLFNFTFYEHIYSQQQKQQYQRQNSYQQSSSYQKPTSLLDDAYTLLGVAKSTPMTEVKRAYRRLMSQNHPDKLMAKGLPEEMLKIATEKTQRIQAAYEMICEARGTA